MFCSNLIPLLAHWHRKISVSVFSYGVDSGLNEPLYKELNSEHNKFQLCNRKQGFCFCTFASQLKQKGRTERFQPVKINGFELSCRNHDGEKGRNKSPRNRKRNSYRFYIRRKNVSETQSVIAIDCIEGAGLSLWLLRPRLSHSCD